MFDVGPFEIITIAVVALLIFGPDKLPKLASDAARLIREIRRMATGARQELADSLGPELNDVSLQDLNPATFVKRNLLDPIDDEVRAVKDDVGSLDGKTSKRPRTPSDSPSVTERPRPTFDADTT